MIFFSSLAFTVLENAMSVIFLHRVVARKRRFIFSALIPYCYILSLGVGLLLMTLVAGSLQAVGKRERRPVRPRPGRCTAFPACCSTCSASPARSSC